MTIREYVSQLFGYRIKNGEHGWDEAAQLLEKNGTWSIAGSPRKFQDIIMELCKRVERLEAHGEREPETSKTIQSSLE